MKLSWSKYYNLLLITLVILLAIPCPVKKEIKHSLRIETNQQNIYGNIKIACSSFCELIQPVKQKKDQKQNVHFSIASRQESPVVIAENIQPDGFCRQKEKIPSYLLFERLLI